MSLADPSMEEPLEMLCKKLRCSVMNADLQNLQHAREILSKLENIKHFGQEVIPQPEDDEEPKDCFCEGYMVVASTEQEEISPIPDSEEVDEEECVCFPVEVQEDLPENCWHGFFKGYQILSEAIEHGVNENKKCIELTKTACDEDIDVYLRSGIQCFVIDLFTGTNIENQLLIVRLRESESKISKEIGFPVTSTLLAKLSPRLQYTGMLDPPCAEIELHKNDDITLTTDRYWSTRGSKRHIYVNALFLLPDVKPCDFLPIGPTIQVRVKQVLPDRLRCVVSEGGTLMSRQPVLFPSRCRKFNVSVEEIEDIIFAREVGINIVVSHILGTKEYFDQLRNVFNLLLCQRMRLFARLVLNEVRGCEDEILWALQNYDGFYIELKGPDIEEECTLLKICPVAESFMERAYELKKPVIFDPTLISTHRILVNPDNYMHVFFYPDKYVFKCCSSLDSFYFYYLQNAHFGPMPALQLANLAYCDESHTGSDTLARSCVAASIEANATAIFVCSITGRMAIKISHFRPKAPIILITGMKSASDFVCVYHQLMLLQFREQKKKHHLKSIFKHLLFGLLFAKSRRLIHNNQNVIFVYSTEEGTKLPDKYILFKFDSRHFADHLKRCICG